MATIQMMEARAKRWSELHAKELAEKIIKAIQGAQTNDELIEKVDTVLSIAKHNRKMYIKTGLVEYL